MKFKKDIVDYLKNNPKTAAVFIHKDTGVHFFNQPTVFKTVTVKEGGNSKTEKKFSADKDFEEFSREEVLKAGYDAGAEGNEGKGKGKSKKDDKKDGDNDNAGAEGNEGK